MTFRTLLVAALLAVASAQTAQAADFTVTTTVDGGPGSLRQAIIDANALNEASTINLASGSVYHLTIPDPGLPVVPGAGTDTEDAAVSGDLDVTSPITINGNGSTIVGDGSSRIFQVLATARPLNSSLTLNDLTVTGGSLCVLVGSSWVGGGGIAVTRAAAAGERVGSLVLNRSTVTGNHTSPFCGAGGGGIWNDFGSVRLTESTVSGNLGSPGGGIYNTGSLNITRSTISGNTAGSGGGIYLDGFETLTSSTIAQNRGAGLWNNSGSLTLKNVTIARNDATGSGLAGGIVNSGSMSVFNTIVGNNTGGYGVGRPLDCTSIGGSVSPFGLSLSTTQCNFGFGSIADPLLGHLGIYGGPTQTVPILRGSPAIDQGTDSFFPGTDQRGKPKSNGRSDIGAFEFYDGMVAAFDFTPATPHDGDTVAFNNLSTSTNAGPVTFSWDLGAGDPPTSVTNPTQVYRAPDHPVTYTATLTALDAAGSVDEVTHSVVVRPINEKPYARFTVGTAKVDHPTSFDASASIDPDGSIVSYRWMWGDGTAAALLGTPFASHTYTSAGTFTATLEVTDNGGRTDATSMSVRVAPIQIYVDASWLGLPIGTDPDGAGPATAIGTDAFAIIGDATHASAGDATIHVAPGLYNHEDADGFAIRGTNDQLLGAGRALTVIRLDVTGSVRIEAPHVVVSGLDIEGLGSSITRESLVRATADDATVVGNKIAGGSVGVHVAQANRCLISQNIITQTTTGIEIDSGSNNQIRQNVIDSTGDAAAREPQGGVLITSSRAAAANNEIADNTISNTLNHGIIVGSSNTSIHGNTITSSGRGPSAGWVSTEPSGIAIAASGVEPTIGGITIADNSILSSGYAGVRAGPSVDGVTIERNRISGTLNGGKAGVGGVAAGGSGIYVDTFGAKNVAINRNALAGNAGWGIFQADAGGLSSANAAHHNDISGNGGGGVMNGQTSPDFDATNNWWGSPTGPAGPGLSGTGDQVSAHVLVSPWETSAACNGLNVGCGLKLAVIQQPGSAYAGSRLGIQPIVEVRDAGGHLVSASTIAVTVSLTPAPGQASAVLSGTRTVNAVGGVVTFSDLAIDRAGSYELQFVSPDADGTSSAPFNVIGSTVTGFVREAATRTPVGNALVQVCNGTICSNASTDATGSYAVTGVTPGAGLVAIVFPPSASNLTSFTSAAFDVPGGGATSSGHDFYLAVPVNPPPTTTLYPSFGTPPRVYWTLPEALSATHQCAGGTAVYTVDVNGTMVVSAAPMTEGPPGTYTATVLPLQPHHGSGQVTITITCPGGSVSSISFSIYVDPSGTVARPDGSPVSGATVTLLRFDAGSGSFVPVPDGAAIMSPANRANPDRSNASGLFGWDTLAGTYKVRAEKPGCHAPGTGASFVESAAFDVPPPKDDLVLVLDCPNNSTRTSLTSSANPVVAGHDVTFTATVASEGSPLSIGSVRFSDAGVTIGVPIPLDGAGHAQVTTSTLPPGHHAVRADYVPGPGYDTSGDGLDQVVIGDTEPPVTNASPAPAANSAGWNNTDVTVKLDASDGTTGSGVDHTYYSVDDATCAPTSRASCTTYSGPFTLTHEGRHAVRFFSVDLAGNAESPHVLPVWIDKTAPRLTVAASRPPDSADGLWYLDVWEVSVTAMEDPSLTDGTAGSGVDTSTRTAPARFTTSGRHTYTATVKDLAGNESAPATLTGQVDADPPHLHAVATSGGAPYASGTWTNKPVIVTFVCTDGESGVASFTPPVTVSADGANQSASGTCKDNVGHSVRTTFDGIDIDTVAPEAAVRFDPATHSLAVVGRDALSGVAGGAITPTILPRGLRSYTVADRAGNTLVLVLKLKRDEEDEGLKGSIVSLQYGSAAATLLASNQFHFQWSLVRDGSLKHLEQQLTLGHDNAQKQIEAQYTAKRNTTRIDVENGPSVVRPGLVLLRFVTNAGQLGIEY